MSSTVIHLGCRKWSASICGLQDLKHLAGVSVWNENDEPEGSMVTAIVEHVTCPGCLTAIDRALELGYRPKAAWLGPRSSRSWWWKKTHAPKGARPCRIARPSSVGGWLEANGLVLTDLYRSEP